MELDLTFFALAVPAVIFAGISKGGFGSGAAFAGASILALVIPPSLALGLMLPLLMLIDAASLRAYWRRWSWTDSRVLILGSMPGLALGYALWRVASDDAIRLLIGVISIAFVVWQIAKHAGWRAHASQKLATIWGYPTGAVLGFTSFVSHAGGPVAAVYLLSRGLSKVEYQATTVLVFGSVNLIKAVLYANLGAFTSETLWACVLLAPAALLGTWIGVRAHHVISQRAFFGVTYILLTITGAKLIWDALT